MKKNYPSLAIIFEAILKLEPNQERFLKKSFTARNANLCKFSNNLATKIITLLGADLESACSDYIWMCEKILEEEIYFRRNSEYRIQSINQAIREVYANADFMARYLNGILISQVVWFNHIYSMYFYEKKYLSKLQNDANHLEIGPGHGLLLQLASECPKNLKLTALDISETSLSKTSQCFQKITSGATLNTITANIMDSVSLNEKFDSIVMSELLEHLESPEKALQIIKKYLNSNGKIYLNIPINSPAPDHIFLFTNPAEILNMVTRNGFEIIETVNVPMTGHELQTCLDKKLTISCLVSASLKQN